MRRSAVSRRVLCAAALLATACKRANDQYFGSTALPGRNRLRYALGGEPASLDPAYYTGGFESYVTCALFEGLTSYHPATLEPMAALATHCEVEPGASRITLYLRGHPHPGGMALPNTDTLRLEYLAGESKEDYSRAHAVPPDSIPARWSDGEPVTAHDFVYSWRRVADSQTFAPCIFRLYAVRNAREIQEKKLPPHELGVRALDDFALQIDLQGPPALFLQLLISPVLAAVPRRAVEAARHKGRESSWTEPGQIITNGAFLLQKHRAYENIIVTRNPGYYERDLVGLEEIEFLPIADGVTTANLYLAGKIHAMPGERLSPLLNPVLEGRRDFHSSPAYFAIWYSFNTRKPPFDNLLLRYAFNMATDKEAIARCYGGGRKAARNVIPAMQGYPQPRHLRISIEGQIYDVLSYDPQGARSLLAKAGYPNGVGKDGRPLCPGLSFPTLPHSRAIAEMLHQQWRANLNVEPKLLLEEFTVWLQNAQMLEFEGVTEAGGWPDFLDPKGFLDWFANGSSDSGSGYADAAFDELLVRADMVADPQARMQKLAECERRLLTSMPVIPIYHNVWHYLQKPFVRGLPGNVLDKHPFKYTWLDTNWRTT